MDYFPLGHYNLGNYYLGQKIYSKGAEEYQTAVRQNPDYRPAKTNLWMPCSSQRHNRTAGAR